MRHDANQCTESVRLMYVANASDLVFGKHAYAFQLITVLSLNKYRFRSGSDVVLQQWKGQSGMWNGLCIVANNIPEPTS